MEPSDDDELATRGSASGSPAGVGGAKLSVAAGGVTVSESVLDEAGTASVISARAISARGRVRTPICTVAAVS